METFLNKIILIIIFIFPSSIWGKDVLLQSTTSTKNSGFYSYILPIFKNETGINVKVVAVGTGPSYKKRRKL